MLSLSLYYISFITTIRFGYLISTVVADVGGKTVAIKLTGTKSIMRIYSAIGSMPDIFTWNVGNIRLKQKKIGIYLMKMFPQYICAQLLNAQQFEKPNLFSEISSEFG